MSKNSEQKNHDYLNKLLGGNMGGVPDDVPKPSSPTTNVVSNDIPGIEYINVNINILPAGRFYKKGTKISIRAAKVSEIQAYSMVDDKNFVDITEKMNDLLSLNVIYTHPDGTKGSYKNLKDSDRVFILFMIRELTFQGGNTLTKEINCSKCNNDFFIPFRSTPNNDTPTTFELYEPNEDIEKFYNKETQTYELIYNGVSLKLAPPTIGIQEDFYAEIKRNVQIEKKPDVVFMKLMPFLLHDLSSITEEEIKIKYKEFKEMTKDDDIDSLVLFQGINEIINKMTVGIKGLKMKCPKCGTEVHTDLTFPRGASSLFELPNILDRFGR